MRTTIFLTTMALATGAFAGLASAQGAAPAPAVEHKTVAPADIKWVDGPPVFPKGMKMTVLYGDPAKAGDIFIIRAKVPAHYKIMPHTHPTAENVTILSGAAAIGMGDKMDPKTKALGAGTFYSMPAGMHHYFFTTKETIIQVSAMGPFQINYLNPADDPSKPAAK